MPAVEGRGKEAAYAHIKAAAITDQGSILIAPMNGTSSFLFTVNASSLRSQFACAQTGLGKIVTRASLGSFPLKNKGKKRTEWRAALWESYTAFRKLETFDLFYSDLSGIVTLEKGESIF